MPLTILSRARDLFRMKWDRSDINPGRALALKGVEKRRREALTIQERKDAMTRDLMALRAAGWPDMSR